MYGRRFFSIHRVEALLQFIGTLKVMARFGDKRPPLTPWLSGPVSPSTMQGQRKAFFATSPLSQEDGASLAPWQPSRRREPQTQDRTPRSSKFGGTRTTGGDGEGSPRRIPLEQPKRTLSNPGPVYWPGFFVPGSGRAWPRQPGKGQRREGASAMTRARIGNLGENIKQGKGNIERSSWLKKPPPFTLILPSRQGQFSNRPGVAPFATIGQSNAQ